MVDLRKQDITERETKPEDYKESIGASCRQDPITKNWVLKPNFVLKYEKKSKIRQLS